MTIGAVEGGLTRMRVSGGVGTPSLHEQHVTPDATKLPEPFAPSDDPEPARMVEGDAGAVLGEDPGLDRPHARGGGRVDEIGEEESAHTSALVVRVHVDTVFDHTGAAAAI